MTRVPPTPGEVLQDQFLNKPGHDEAWLANRLHVSVDRVRAILNADIPITVSCATRLAAALKTTPDYWIEIQAVWDTWAAKVRALVEQAALADNETSPATTHAIEVSLLQRAAANESQIFLVQRGKVRYHIPASDTREIIFRVGHGNLGKGSRILGARAYHAQPFIRVNGWAIHLPVPENSNAKHA